MPRGAGVGAAEPAGVESVVVWAGLVGMEVELEALLECGSLIPESALSSPAERQRIQENITYLNYIIHLHSLFENPLVPCNWIFI